MDERISIRETARRLGVSDTAVHKAIRAGRVVVERDAKGRPVLAWPRAQRDWSNNSDAMKRTHVGPQGSSPRRQEYGGNAPAPAAVPTREEMLGGGADVPSHGPSLAQSRAVREAFQARLSKLEYERAVGKVVDADRVKADAFKVARQVRDSLLNIPDRVAAELAAETNAARVHARLSAELRQVLAGLAASSQAAGAGAA